MIQRSILLISSGEYRIMPMKQTHIKNTKYLEKFKIKNEINYLYKYIVAMID